MDVMVPMASQPSAMSGRNWIVRRLIIDSITQDPEWNGGVMEAEMKRVKNGRLHLTPASADTAGHGTTGNAKWYKAQLAEVLSGPAAR